MTVTRSEYPESIEDSLPIDETDRTISSSKVEGTAVYGADGEKFGHVRNFMVDKYSGQVLYAVMSFGGFLGIGERYHALPWRVLRYDPKLGGYVVGLKKEVLRAAPTFAANEEPLFDRNYGLGVYGHYGVPFP
jgi:sporulation protein YlmC with PRC-barrel domain